MWLWMLACSCMRQTQTTRASSRPLSSFMGMRDNGHNFALDDTGKNQPALDCSHLYKEYTSCLAPGSIGLEIFLLLADSERLKFFLRPSRAIWSLCETLIPRNKGDAIALGAATQTKRRLLVTNDFDDFDPKTRKAIGKQLKVAVQATNGSFTP